MPALRKTYSYLELDRLAQGICEASTLAEVDKFLSRQARTVPAIRAALYRYRLRSNEFRKKLYTSATNRLRDYERRHGQSNLVVLKAAQGYQLWVSTSLSWAEIAKIVGWASRGQAEQSVCVYAVRNRLPLREISSPESLTGGASSDNSNAS